MEKHRCKCGTGYYCPVHKLYGAVPTSYEKKPIVVRRSRRVKKGKKDI